jgi:hypothetical protein
MCIFYVLHLPFDQSNMKLPVIKFFPTPCYVSVVVLNVIYFTLYVYFKQVK